MKLSLILRLLRGDIQIKQLENAFQKYREIMDKRGRLQSTSI